MGTGVLLCARNVRIAFRSTVRPYVNGVAHYFGTGRIVATKPACLASYSRLPMTILTDFVHRDRAEGDGQIGVLLPPLHVRDYKHHHCVHGECPWPVHADGLCLPHLRERDFPIYFMLLRRF